jgi:hypothetical protein
MNFIVSARDKKLAIRDQKSGNRIVMVFILKEVLWHVESIITCPGAC